MSARKNPLNHTEKLCLLLLYNNVVLTTTLQLTEKIPTLSKSFALSIFSITVVFQCDFQCHILKVMVLYWIRGTYDWMYILSVASFTIRLLVYTKDYKARL